MPSIVAMNAENHALQHHNLPDWVVWFVIIFNTVGILYMLYDLWRKR